MAYIVTSLPNPPLVYESVTIFEILAALPDPAPFPYNFGFSGRLARDGRVVKGSNIVFLTDIGREPTAAEKQCFTSYLAPIGLTCTVSQYWGNDLKTVRLYNQGNLCLDRTTAKYSQVPTPCVFPPVFTYDQYKSLLPAKLPVPSNQYFPRPKDTPPAVDPLMQDIYTTGSIIYNKGTCNDVDMFAGQVILDAKGKAVDFVRFKDQITLATIRNYFTSILPLPAQCGQTIMTNLEVNGFEIPMLLTYRNGVLCPLP